VKFFYPSTGVEGHPHALRPLGQLEKITETRNGFL